ncbi:MAG: hypothetical protein ACR2LY_07610 [Thermoleophilaceae bacterium]
MSTEPGSEDTQVIAPSGRRRLRVAGAGLALALLGAGGWLLAGGVSAEPAPAPVRAAARAPEPPPPRPRPQVVRAVAPGEGGAEDDVEASAEDAESEPSEPATDDDVRQDVKELKAALRTGRSVKGARARLDGRGDAIPPSGVPQTVAQVVEAANVIARKPYVYGGGHGAWRDRGYDCSGSVSFALAGAGLLDRPLDSSGFMRWGSNGRGRWITIYANPGHMFMVVAGLRFDTSGANGGTRWQEGMRGGGSYAVRHPAGL